MWEKVRKYRKLRRNKGALLYIQGMKSYILTILNGLLLKKGTFCGLLKEQAKNKTNKAGAAVMNFF